MRPIAIHSSYGGKGHETLIRQRRLRGSQTTRRALSLCLTRLHQVEQELLRQDSVLRRADLLALTPTASGNGEDLPCYPVGALVSYAIDLAGDRVARWCGMVHGLIMDEQTGHFGSP